MWKLWQLLAVVVVGVSLGVAVIGCGTPSSTNKDKMGGDKMGGEKMSGDKMSGDKMSGDKMGDDKMGGNKMGGDKKMEANKGGM